MRAVITICLLLAYSIASAETIAGKPQIIDADTIEISGENIRLEGIVAPESRQECENRYGHRYRCGQTTARALRRHIGRAEIQCKISGTGRYGRLLATCYKNHSDINRWLVKEGHAIAYRKYTIRYSITESGAKRGKRGIWQGRFVDPEKLRRGQRLNKKRPA